MSDAVFDLDYKYKEYQKELDWVSSEYDTEFASYFLDLRKLNRRLHGSVSNSLSNEEIEHVLLNTPLDMIEVSEKLDNIRMIRDVTKIDIKEARNSSDAKEKQSEIYNNEVFVRVVDSLIDRVEKQISFSKEFIMSCKKVWDSRMSNSSPISPIDSNDDIPNEYENLPEYKG